MNEVSYAWRMPVDNQGVQRVHAAAFGIDPPHDDDWATVLNRYSLGWVTAHVGETLVGFLNVLTDGIAHAWLQDVVVDPDHQRSGIGLQMVRTAVAESAAAGLEWMHVDFDDVHAGFYFDACGFTSTAAGLRYLR